MSETIDFSNINSFNPSDKVNSITINNIKKEDNISPEHHYNISKHLNENGTIFYSFNSELSKEEYDNFVVNMTLSGLINITQDKNVIKANFKDWSLNNKIKADFSNVDCKNSKPEQKGVTKEDLIDPFNLYQILSDDMIVKGQPCANCTCGRGPKKPTNEEIKFGGCGRCHLGDDKRCANCPYRGLPMFNPGDKLKINENINNIDTNNNNEMKTEDSGINIKNNKVKLDI